MTLPAIQPTDNNDQIGEAVSLGAMTQNRTVPSGTIDSPTDVDMFSFSVVAGQRLAFDIDRPSGNFDSYLRLFDVNGNQLDFNDDRAAPGESSSNDSYLEFTFSTAQTFFVGVSGYRNHSYNPVTGTGDSNGSTGNYTLIVSAPRSIRSAAIPGSNLGVGGLLNSIRVTLARIDDNNAPVDPTLPTWLIIHGRVNSPTSGYFRDLNTAVGGYSDNDQVLTLDWSQDAFDNARSLSLEGSRWITAVASWTAETLLRQGLSPSRLDIIGHSWGAHVANEIAASLAAQTGSRVRSFVALDPAVLPAVGTPASLGNRYTRSTDFSANSRFSWGFNSSVFGSDASASSAHESFNVVVGNYATTAAHSNVISLFATMVSQNRQGPTRVSTYFRLDRLQMGQRREEWLINPNSQGFEAAILGTLRDRRWEPQNLGYYSQNDGSLVIV